MGKNEKSRFDTVAEMLKDMPFWVGPLLAALLFVFLRSGILYLTPVPNAGQYDQRVLVRSLMPLVAWMAAGFVLLAWIGAEFHKLRNRAILNSRGSVESLANLSWQEFERLVCEAYRQKGYAATVVGNDCGDGGVDVELKRTGETVLVQCKCYKEWKVGVTTVREMLGVVVQRRAQKGIVVTSGKFTADARRFAQGAEPPIELVDGAKLFELIRSVRGDAREITSVEPAKKPTPACPTCGTTMVLRAARKGGNARSQFWGCPNYPACRGIRKVV